MLSYLQCVFLFFWGVSQHVLAQTGHNPSAHVHGEGQIMMAYEAGYLDIVIQSPAANFLGFEHSPHNDNERQAVKALHATLNNPKNIIRLAPVCKVIHKKVQIPFAQETGDTPYVKHGGANHSNQPHDHRHSTGHKHTPIYQADHNHQDNHNHNHKDDHHHDDDQLNNNQLNNNQHNKQHHAVHQDIDVTYQWHCSGKTPPAITLAVFERFPGFNRFHVQWIANGRQGAKILNKNTKVLAF